MVIDTGIFKMNGKSFALEMISTYGKKWIALLLVLSLPALAAGIFHDLRWIVVFFMIICLVAPLMLSFLYFYYGLSPLASFNVASHSLKFIENGIFVTVFNIVADPDTKSHRNIRNIIPLLFPTIASLHIPRAHHLSLSCPDHPKRDSYGCLAMLSKAIKTFKTPFSCSSKN